MNPGWQEMFRCRGGLGYVCLEGPPAARPVGRGLAGEPTRSGTTLILRPGRQHLVPSNTLHWFQVGLAGAIVSKFATRIRDDLDGFTDPDIARSIVITST
jgi:hypothetical protein